MKKKKKQVRKYVRQLVDREGRHKNFEEVELHHYVQVYRTSSDRSRWALYIVILVSLLVFVGKRNSAPHGGPVARLEEWLNENPATGWGAFLGSSNPTLDESGQVKIVKIDSDKLGSVSLSPADILADEYLRQFVSRAVVISSPIPGVWVDERDLGLVGGIVLILLMLVLLVCLLREHENLYLSFFRVRALCKTDPGHHLGTSKANLLYHTLAMTQVLRSPPTLARRAEWHGKVLAGVISLTYFIPLSVYLYVKGHQLNQGIEVWLIGSILLLLGIFCFICSTAMGARWRKAFLRVNPSLEYVPQAGFGAWFKLPWFCKIPPWEWHLIRISPRAISKVVDSVRVKECGVVDEGTVTVCREIDPKSEHLRRSHIRRMTRELTEQGWQKARESLDDDVEFVELTRFKVTRNCLSLAGRKTRWLVQGEWTFCYRET